MKPDTSTHCRSIAKATSWETFSTLVVFVLALGMFGSLGICITFAVVSFFVKLILFYFHERIWHQIEWGKELTYGQRRAQEIAADLKRQLRRGDYLVNLKRINDDGNNNGIDNGN